MSCHGDNKNNQNGHNHSPLKHMLHMVLCCGLPIVIVGLLPFISRISPSAGSAVSKIVPFLCPIMMVSMMFMMSSGKKKGSCCDNTNNDGDNSRLPEINNPVE